MLGEEISYQTLASYALYIIIACIVILLVTGLFRLFGRSKQKKKLRSMEKNIEYIYEELKKLNDKLDKIYYKDSDDFVDKE